MLKNWGIHKLAEKKKHESTDEMKHADILIERILFLEGIPNLQDLSKLKIGEDVKEILECDLKLEYEGIPLLKEAIAYCKNIKDYISRDLIQKIQDSEEEHIDFLETNLSLIDKIGIKTLSKAGFNSLLWQNLKIPLSYLLSLYKFE